MYKLASCAKVDLILILAHGVDMYIKRDLEEVLLRYAKFPAVALLGPRQSGKTTLARKVFSQHRYVSFEDYHERFFAMDDPRGFLKKYENEHGIIIDEFQYVPHLLSYLQLDIDEKNRQGYFILTGSQNFLMNEKITQSLAGRVGIVDLYTLSFKELQGANKLFQNCDDVMVRGGYPRLFEQDGIDTADFYSSYVQTYVERDVRQLENVGDINTFHRFLGLCAGRVGQILDFQTLSNDCGVTLVQVKKWISVLEATYIITLLQPFYKNFNRRLIRTPKLYFLDTGLACSLLKIFSAETLSLHPLRGSLFENMIIADLYKQYANMGRRPPLYFWRDQNGRLEVDCIVDHGIALTPIEIKSGQTLNPNFFDGIKAWSELTGNDPSLGFLVYGGDKEPHEWRSGYVVGWRDAKDLRALMKG